MPGVQQVRQGGRGQGTASPGARRAPGLWQAEVRTQGNEQVPLRRAFVSTSSAKKLPVARGAGVSQLLTQDCGSSYSPLLPGESESTLTGRVPQ